MLIVDCVLSAVLNVNRRTPTTGSLDQSAPSAISICRQPIWHRADAELLGIAADDRHRHVPGVHWPATYLASTRWSKYGAGDLMMTSSHCSLQLYLHYWPMGSNFVGENRRRAISGESPDLLSSCCIVFSELRSDLRRAAARRAHWPWA